MASSRSSSPSATSLGSQIKVYCRIKPIDGPFSAYSIAPDPRVSDENGNKNEVLNLWPKQVVYRMKKQFNPFIGPCYNKPEIYSFGFAKVLGPTHSQESVFNLAASPIIESVLDGFNGTIFAYGQTGTGKTHTMTGDLTNPENRGIIPRAIYYIFRKISQHESGSSISNLTVSYLEIYNEVIYDLLTNQSTARKLEDLQKGIIVNNELKNVSKYSLNLEEEAYKLLELGNSNRATAETLQNQASTRSHCIFTLYVSGIRNPKGDARPFYSKLHLVDLAGSERISKQTRTDQTLNESKSINLSLSYLEQVITALNESSRTHIPYRNTMLTTVLKDSLGGNSLTTFLATISMEHKYIQETISTCRFMQRVGQVKNRAFRNENLIHFSTTFQDYDKEVIQTRNQAVASCCTLPSRCVSKDEFCGTSQAQAKPPSSSVSAESRTRLVAELVQHLLETNETQPILQLSCKLYDLRVLSECYTKLRAEVVDSRSNIARLQNETRDLRSTIDSLNTLLQQYETCAQCSHCTHGLKPDQTNPFIYPSPTTSNIKLPQVGQPDEQESKMSTSATLPNSISMGIFSPTPSFREVLVEISPNIIVRIYDAIMNALYPTV